MTTDAAPGTTTHMARIPGSKSLTNRMLLLAASANGTSRIYAPLVCQDTLTFRDALRACEIPVQASPRDEYWEVTGAGQGAIGRARVWCADAGTAARFLPPYAAVGHGNFLFDGSSQLRARPLGALLEALRALGADIDVGPGARLPLLIRAEGLAGGEISVESSSSSQYLSGLLMAAPLMRTGLRVRAPGLVSRPYTDMTLSLMRRYGADATEGPDGSIRVEPGVYAATDMVVEPDASTASYVFAAAAVTGGTVTVPGLGTDSLQGDLRFVEILAKAGAEVSVDEAATTVTGTGQLRGGFAVDMGDVSDTFMTLAAIAALADAPITIHGIGHTRLKESDRLAAVADNLRACGIETAHGTDWITVHPGAPHPARIACHHDHRVAMAFSVLGIASSTAFELDDAHCVAKTFPGFHGEMQRLFCQYELPVVTSVSMEGPR
ncbi:3-phosphoshikimate 1-carboxyvinyltransferase [Streptomyces beihaiensis]|uniref:3-phosphoshikimate 1-carboxyvinyltransferase n=1 Tax=Streptomyces beihaiensis TaxID=2984495 RepID=A0ABT3U3S9_9ACTN|nr:3-phosphoshikimate 1-carboxyvinyltransferase [Streptomyces beihaiensis]MCX3062905.1 3-phosphoshikimate 1-carboxyvinyltransferase [Streptomyces beihaiensis]